MIVLGINNTDYRVYESWSEITIPKAREIYKVALSIPECLDEVYKERAKGEGVDEDQLNLLLDELDNNTEALDSFYVKALRVLSDIPNKIIKQINKDDLKACYEAYLMPLIFGCLYYPLEKINDIEVVETMGEKYFAPESKEVMNIVRPLYNETVGVFCDASDVDNSSKKNKQKYDFAELIISIIYRAKEEIYSEKQSIERAKIFTHLTCDVYHSAIYQLSKTNSVLKQLFPNLFEKGDPKSSRAYKSSGLDDFGWMNSIMTIAQMGVLNQEGLTPLESVRQTNLYDFMTVLSNLRADNKFKRIYQENQNRKK